MEFSQERKRKGCQKENTDWGMECSVCLIEGGCAMRKRATLAVNDNSSGASGIGHQYHPQLSVCIIPGQS